MLYLLVVKVRGQDRGWRQGSRGWVGQRHGSKGWGGDPKEERLEKNTKTSLSTLLSLSHLQIKLAH